MLSEIEAVNPNDDLLEVQRRLAETNVDALPVTQGGAFLGLITNRDINEIYRLASIRSELKGVGETFVPAETT
jgi:predicted transcriptional regulator